MFCVFVKINFFFDENVVVIYGYIWLVLIVSMYMQYRFFYLVCLCFQFLNGFFVGYF